MSAANVDVIRFGGERLRVGPWHGDRSVAFVAPLPDAPPPSPAFVRRCLATLAERGFARAVTSALGPREQDAFLAAGFSVADELHVLSRVLGDVDPPALPDGVRLRRPRPPDRARAVAVDALSFSAFWRLDERGIDEAVRATPRARFRLAELAGVEPAAGYAICGRAGDRGYVQRLAVHPDARRRGIGAALVLDGLHWLQRRGVVEAVVNTQTENGAALRLYEQLGFRRRDAGLRVLESATR